MIKEKKAFTFIELMISILILGLMAVVGISSFQSFFSKQGVTRVQEKIGNIIRSLDLDVESGNISSYSLAFATGANSLIADIDYYKSPQIISLQSFDYPSLSGTLITNNTSTGFWETKVYADNIMKNNYFGNGSGGTLKVNFGNYASYDNIKITSKIGGIPTNYFVIYRLDYTMEGSDKPENTLIDSIISNKAVSMAYIENILGNKTLSTMSGSNSVQVGSIKISLSKGSTNIDFTLKK